MYFPFQFRQYARSLTQPAGNENLVDSGPKVRITRLAALLGMPLYEANNALFMGLDYLFFPQFKDEALSNPIQVVGNPRSGTTFLHRLLAKDEDNFVTTKAWQMIFPSVTQQRLIQRVGQVDALLGGRLSRRFDKLEQGIFKNSDKFHKMRMSEPEEDEGFFIHPFASGFLALTFPRDDWEDYNKLDEQPESLRRELMGYYRRCVQRVVFQDPKRRRLLSKNPLFNAKLKSVRETFPDVKIVYLVRHPADMLCSVQNMLLSFWMAQGMTVPEGKSLRRPGLVDWAEYNYRHALEVLDGLPKGSYCIVKYDDLVKNPKATVEGIYRELDIEMTDNYADTLQAEMEKAKNYKSKHKYSLEKFDLTHQEVEERLGFIYDRFDFPRVATAAPGDDKKAS